MYFDEKIGHFELNYFVAVNQVLYFTLLFAECVPCAHEKRQRTAKKKTQNEQTIYLWCPLVLIFCFPSLQLNVIAIETVCIFKITFSTNERTNYINKLNQLVNRWIDGRTEHISFRRFVCRRWHWLFTNRNKFVSAPAIANFCLHWNGRRALAHEKCWARMYCIRVYDRSENDYLFVIVIIIEHFALDIRYYNGIR